MHVTCCFLATQFTLHRLCGGEHPSKPEPKSGKLGSFLTAPPSSCHELALVSKYRNDCDDYACLIEDLHNVDLFSGHGAVNRAFGWVLNNLPGSIVSTSSDELSVINVCTHQVGV